MTGAPGIAKVTPSLAQEQQRALQDVEHAGRRGEVKLPHQTNTVPYGFYRLCLDAVPNSLEGEWTGEGWRRRV